MRGIGQKSNYDLKQQFPYGVYYPDQL
jgi:hypothetical protein